jgi:hypothetical protein
MTKLEKLKVAITHAVFAIIDAVNASDADGIDAATAAYKAAWGAYEEELGKQHDKT